jgi:hypothetical protein
METAKLPLNFPERVLTMTFKKYLMIFGFALVAVGCADMSIDQSVQAGMNVAKAAGSGSKLDYTRGVKEALELSSGRATALLGKAGGYSRNPLYKITMPASVSKVTKTLRSVGLGGQVDQVESLMNRGAEQAAGEAKAVFIDAVRQMTVTDALGIVRGGNTAATDYFKAKTDSKLRAKYLPIIRQNLGEVGFYNQYKTLLNSYNALPLAKKPDLDLEQHVLNKSLDGLFAQIAREEVVIRQDPLRKGSEYLSRVFTK